MRDKHNTQLENSGAFIMPQTLPLPFLPVMRMWGNADLYSSECLQGSEVQKNFLDDLDLPCTLEEQKKDLNKVISLKEVVDAIELMKAGKAVGPALLSLDAEKAFDRVEWDFLFDVLKRYET